PCNCLEKLVLTYRVKSQSWLTATSCKKQWDNSWAIGATSSPTQSRTDLLMSWSLGVGSLGFLAASYYIELQRSLLYVSVRGCCLSKVFRSQTISTVSHHPTSY